jgi:hypothetical protein
MLGLWIWQLLQVCDNHVKPDCLLTSISSRGGRCGGHARQCGYGCNRRYGICYDSDSIPFEGNPATRPSGIALPIDADAVSSSTIALPSEEPTDEAEPTDTEVSFTTTSAEPSPTTSEEPADTGEATQADISLSSVPLSSSSTSPTTTPISSLGTVGPSSTPTPASSAPFLNSTAPLTTGAPLLTSSSSLLSSVVGNLTLAGVPSSLVPVIESLLSSATASSSPIASSSVVPSSSLSPSSSAIVSGTASPTDTTLAPIDNTTLPLFPNSTITTNGSMYLQIPTLR